jgi:hypothetical protein
MTAAARAVLERARDPHFYHRGWDRVEECATLEEVEAELRGEGIDGENVAGAVAHYEWLVKLWRDQESDVMCQSGEHERRPCGAWVRIGKRCECEEEK